MDGTRFKTTLVDKLSASVVQIHLSIGNIIF